MLKQTLILVTTILFPYQALSHGTESHDKNTPTEKSTLTEKPIHPEHHEPSIPPIGASAFDALLATANNNSVPFPFDKLIRLIKRHTNNTEKHPISLLAFPFGRSLQRFAAAPNFFRYPRLVLSVNSSPEIKNGNLGLDLRHKLFIGYVEPSNMLEVISYNPAMGRYEYQVVKAYKKGAQPKVFYAKRQVCLTCHEMGTPLFPAEPWSETSDNSLLAQAIIKQRGQTHYYGYPIEPKDTPGRGFALPTVFFDFAIDQGVKILHASNIRNMICPANQHQAECRSAALAVAFAQHFGVTKDLMWPPLKVFRTAMNEFFKNNRKITIPFGFLPDRDPYTNRNVQYHHDITTKSPTGDLLKDREILKNNLLSLPIEHDPRARRSLVRPLHRKLCKMLYDQKPRNKWCYTNYFASLLTLQERTKLKSYNLVDIESALRSKEMLRGPLTRPVLYGPEILLHLLKSLDAKTTYKATLPHLEKAPFGLSIKRQTPESLLNATTVTLPSLKQFYKSCGGCHNRQGLTYPIQFLVAANEKAVLKKIKINRKAIQDCLKGTQYPMPPHGSQEHAQLTPEEQIQMLTTLKNL